MTAHPGTRWEVNHSYEFWCFLLIRHLPVPANSKCKINHTRSIPLRRMSAAVIENSTYKRILKGHSSSRMPTGITVEESIEIYLERFTRRKGPDVPFRHEVKNEPMKFASTSWIEVKPLKRSPVPENWYSQSCSTPHDAYQWIRHSAYDFKGNKIARVSIRDHSGEQQQDLREKVGDLPGEKLNSAPSTGTTRLDVLKLEWDWRRDLTRSSAPIGKIAKREYWLDLGFRICDLMKSAEFWNFGLYAPWDPHRGLLVLRKDLRAPFVVSKDLLELFRDLLALQQDLFALLLDPHADPPTPHRYPHDWQKNEICCSRENAESSFSCSNSHF